MVTENEAVRVAQRCLKKLEAKTGLSLALLAQSKIAFEGGWLVTYQSTEHMRTGNPMAALAGNAPIIVSAEDGGVFLCGTARTPEYYIDEFLAGRLRSFDEI